MIYKKWLDDYVKKNTEPKYYKTYYKGIIFVKDRPIEIDLVIKRKSKL